jgi:hypothetical protein
VNVSACIISTIEHLAFVCDGSWTDHGKLVEGGIPQVEAKPVGGVVAVSF